MGGWAAYQDGLYQSYNEHHQNIYRTAIDREIMQEEQAAIKEQMKQITADFHSELTKEGGKAAREIAAELQKALKGIKL